MKEPSRANNLRAGATFSACRRYRYALWREWDPSKPTIVWCGLNPSTADETVDDPTVRREIAYSKVWGFGHYVKVNAYGWRDTDPKRMLGAAEPVGPDNLATVLHWARQARTFMAAWGNNIRERDAFVLRTALRQHGVAIHVLRLTKKGHPEHPLYLPKDLLPFEWAAARARA